MSSSGESVKDLKFFYSIIIAITITSGIPCDLSISSIFHDKLRLMFRSNKKG